jgi:hypothetical protein
MTTLIIHTIAKLMFYTLFCALIWLFVMTALSTRVWHARNTIIEPLAPVTTRKVRIPYVV